MDKDIKQFFIVGMIVMLAMASFWVILGLGDYQKVIDPIYINIIKIIAAIILGIIIIIGIRKVLKR